QVTDETGFFLRYNNSILYKGDGTPLTKFGIFIDEVVFDINRTYVNAVGADNCTDRALNKAVFQISNCRYDGYGTQDIDSKSGALLKAQGYDVSVNKCKISD